MSCYEIDGVVPVVDPTAFVHPAAVLIGDVIVGPGCYIGLMVGNPARVVRELHAETLAWKRNGVHIYQQFGVRSRAGLRPVEPLTAVEPDRRRRCPRW